MYRPFITSLICISMTASITCAQATGGGGSGGGGTSGGLGGGTSGLGGTTPPGVSNNGSGIGGEPAASGSGSEGLRGITPAQPRPALGPPNVGNIGAPSAIDPASNRSSAQHTPKDDSANRAGTIGPDGVTENTYRALPPGRATGRLSSDWRYVYHGGRHWYWMPNKSWNLWNGAAWAPYPAGGLLNRTAQSQMQMRGYRRQAIVNYPRAYDERGMQGPIAPANPQAPRDGTRDIGPRRYSATVGPQQGLPPQNTTPLPKSPAQVNGQDVLETVPDASGVTVP